VTVQCIEEPCAREQRFLSSLSRTRWRSARVVAVAFSAEARVLVSRAWIAALRRYSRPDVFECSPGNLSVPSQFLISL